MQTVLVKVVMVSCLLVCFTLNSYVNVNNNNDLQTLSNNVQLKKIIRLKPNPSFDGNIVIESLIQDSLSIYLFDKEANLVRQFNLKGKSRYAVKNLKKGSYMYDVFLDEESIENGNIQVK